MRTSLRAPGAESPESCSLAAGLRADNSLYHGILWDARVNVVGDAYRVGPNTPGPLFGIPHSGHYFLSNGSGANHGILLTTDQVLLGAWFGRNE
jgi:hypothetical protein